MPTIYAVRYMTIQSDSFSIWTHRTNFVNNIYNTLYDHADILFNTFTISIIVRRKVKQREATITYNFYVRISLFHK